MAENEEHSYIAEAINPLAVDAEYLAKVIFAEDAAGGEAGWRGVGNVALNRLKSGYYGTNLKKVLSGMSSAVQTKSAQWQKVDKGELNQFEQMVFERIRKVAESLLAEDNQDNTGGATLFENIERFGFPNSWDKTKVQATKRIGRHTYFIENRRSEEKK